MRRYAGLWWVMLRASVSAQMQYRVNFVVSVLTGLIYSFVGLALVWLITSRFQTIGGWTFAQIAFVYGLRQTVHGVWVLCTGELIAMPHLIREGRLDRYLVRPVSPLFQVMTKRIILAATGDVTAGIGMLLAGAAAAGISWTAWNVLFVLLTIAGGVLVQGSFYLGLAALSIRVVELRSLIFVVGDLFAAFGGYPMHAFTRPAQVVFTFVLPIAFVAYLPAAVLLGETGSLTMPAFLAYGAPVVGGLLFGGALLIWRNCLNHYQGAGH
ncbi:ABC transporter permease [Nonomuraea africana]|uniref:ABC-2 type transport system permease protein n=1 Tax=Nonomuraea africana TaxID=46171 RepID=A0ABR9KNX7_9ACTN|nr:ABC-2 family transporter protein [Nonomuraea africana]MBE1563733.1 ABC-2 type transport system permease protein [Nonomuraea africana]